MPRKRKSTCPFTFNGSRPVNGAILKVSGCLLVLCDPGTGEWSIRDVSDEIEAPYVDSEEAAQYRREAIGVLEANNKAIALMRAPHAGYDYYIDTEGHACRADGAAVRAEEVEVDEPIYDYRTGSARDRETIIWADGSTGAQPGMVFSGPG